MLEATTAMVLSISLSNIEACLGTVRSLEGSGRADLMLPIAALGDSEEGRAHAYSAFEGAMARGGPHSYSSVDYATCSASSDSLKADQRMDPEEVT